MDGWKILPIVMNAVFSSDMEHPRRVVNGIKNHLQNGVEGTERNVSEGERPIRKCNIRPFDIFDEGADENL